MISKLYRVQFLLGLYFCGSLLVLRDEESARDWTCDDAEGLTLQFELEYAAHGDGGAIDHAGRACCVERCVDTDGCTSGAFAEGP
jgi:hypothetical protein